MMEEGYGLKKGDIVRFKCEVVETLPSCVVLVEGRNVGEEQIRFVCHVNSLKKEEKE
jgi:hypothetical protein